MVENDDDATVIGLFARNLDHLLTWAGDIPRFKDRAPIPELLADYIAAQRWPEGAVSKRQIYRYLNREQAASIVAVDLIARAFELEAWEMLVPEFHVGIRHFVLTANEKQMFEDMKATARRFVIHERREGSTDGGVHNVGDDSAPPAPSASHPAATERAKAGRPAPARKRKKAPKAKAGH